MSYRNHWKRLFDICLALAALTLLWPLLLAVAAAVRLESQGPVIFRQRRGAGGQAQGRLFEMYKFRSMRVDSDAERKGFEPGGRSRITRVGAVLRKTKLDELPQLFNVIKGDMSIVGPRPEVPRYLELYPERWRTVLSASPGITDPASVVYRDEEDILSNAADSEKTYTEVILPRKLELYERYVAEITLAGDISILIDTAAAVLGLRRDDGNLNSSQKH